MSKWIIEKMAGHCGACLYGVSLKNAPMSALEQMRNALFQNGVIIMPKQFLNLEEHIALAKFFGSIDVFYPKCSEVTSIWW